jgi:hypothetical protein
VFGSGVRKYFVNNVLGISAETNATGWNPPTSGVIPAGHPGAGGAITCPPAIGAGNATPFGQSDGSQFLAPAYRADFQKYITLYSSANWVQQASGVGNPTLDKRAGFRPGALVGVAPSGTFPPAYTVRWTGTAWRVNDGTILGANETGARSQAGVTSAGQFASTLTGAPGTFLASDVGLNVQGAFVNDGTVITAVAAGGASATITPGAKAAGTGSVTIGWAVVSEKNPNVPGAGTGAGTQYPGVRFTYLIIRPDAPSYTAARNLIGYDDTAPAGQVSDVCNGNDAGIIEDYGFLPLTPLDPTGPGIGNDQLVTCRKQ